LFFLANSIFLISAALCEISAFSLIAADFSSSYWAIFASVASCCVCNASFLSSSICLAYSFILSSSNALSLAFSRFSSISISFNLYFSFYFASPITIFSSMASLCYLRVNSRLAAPSSSLSFTCAALTALSSFMLASLAAFASLSCYSLSFNSFSRYSFLSTNSLSYSSFFLAISSYLILVSSSFAFILSSLSFSFNISFSLIIRAFSSYLSMFP